MPGHFPLTKCEGPQVQFGIVPLMRSAVLSMLYPQLISYDQ